MFAESEEVFNQVYQSRHIYSLLETKGYENFLYNLFDFLLQTNSKKKKEKTRKGAILQQINFKFQHFTQQFVSCEKNCFRDNHFV